MTVTKDQLSIGSHPQYRPQAMLAQYDPAATIADHKKKVHAINLLVTAALSGSNITAAVSVEKPNARLFN